MCMFMSTLPRFGNGEKKKNIGMYLRPTEKNELYRFRLLAFAGIGTDRKFPFIERYKHIHWGKTDDGKPTIDGEIVCPVTKWAKWDGDRYSCPICRLAGTYYNSYKESGYKNREAGKKNKEFARKYEACIPVYVVNDPTYPGNNGKFRVLIINDKDVYKDFVQKVKNAADQGSLSPDPAQRFGVFNSENAIDCCFHMTEQNIVANEGLPNAYTFKKRVIDRVVFSNKAYTIPAITKEAIDAFPFDEQYYQSSTPEEVQDFYNKFCKISNDDIPMDDDATTVFTAPAAKPVVSKPVQTVTAPPPPPPMDDVLATNVQEDIDNLVNDIPTSNASAPAAKPADNAPADDDNIDDMFAELGIN